MKHAENDAKEHSQPKHGTISNWISPKHIAISYNNVHPFQEANAALAKFQARTDEIIKHMTNSTVDITTISTLTHQNETLTT